MTGKIRMTILVPTESMVADALTKPMISPGLLQLLTTGRIEIFGTDGHPVLSRVLPSLQDYDEQMLMKGDDEIIQMAKDEPHNVRATAASMLYGAIAFAPSSVMRTAMLLGMATLATAHSTETMAAHYPIDEVETDRSVSNNFIGLTLHYGITFIVVILAIMVEKYVNKLSFLAKLWHYLMVFVHKLGYAKVKVEDDPMEVDQMEMRAYHLQQISELTDDLAATIKERDRLREDQLALNDSCNLYKNHLHDARRQLATAEEKIYELEEELTRNWEIIDTRNLEVTRALEQKNYNASRVNQHVAAGKEKDKRIEDLEQQMKDMGNKMARREEPGSASNSSRMDAAAPERPRGLGLHHIDMRVMKEALETAEAEKTKLTQQLQEKKEVIERMERVYKEQQERTRNAMYPEEIRVTAGGTKYHLPRCGHLQRAKKDLPYTAYRRCFDCSCIG